MKSLAAFLFLYLFAGVVSAHAATYYISPSGNDSNNGSSSSPWRTMVKANSAITTGDTVILKNGTYPAYAESGISKSGTTWRAENQYQAIIDGGFRPESLQGQWERLDEIHDQQCEGKGKSVSLLDIPEGVNNVIVDGMTLKNSCGRGLYILGDNNTFQNGRIDWTLIAGVYLHESTQGNKLLNNVMTRMTFDDQLLFQDPNDGEPEGKYRVNVSMYMKGDDMIIRGNTIAWGRGEMAMPFSKNMLFENNIVVGNKNNFYIGWTENMTARNNLFFSPETENTANTHWAYPFGDQQNRNKINWRMSGRAENKGDKIKGISGPKNVMFYNNMVINNSVSFDGYHRSEPSDQPGVQNCFGNEFQNLYYGHNTIIARTQSTNNNLFGFTYTECPGKGGGSSANSSINGIVENNIFDNSKNRAADINFGFDGNDQVTIRNNILPMGTQQIASNIYTNDSGFNGTVEQLKLLHLQIPPIGATISQVDSQDLRNLVNLNHFRLRQGSPAINAGSTAGAVGTTQIPGFARSQDFFRADRIGVPDIGAIEYGGAPPPPPPSSSPSSNPSPSTSASPSPLPSWDLNSDGKINAYDFVKLKKGIGTTYTLAQVKTFLVEML